MGKSLMPWQQHVADVALEIDPETGRFAYREIVLTVPRRSGKSLLLLAILVQRMVAMGRPQVAAFTMQNALQARLRMRREWDAEILSRSSLASAYRFTGQPGAEALLFHNGSRIEVTASTKSSGHGLTLDLAVVDEAFDQPDDRLEQAFRPAIRTQPDAQLWWVSTAGGPEDVWFRQKVDQARAGESSDRGTAVFDWSAPQDADPADPAVWWSCMPALGYTRPDGSGLTEQDIREEYESAARSKSLDGFRRAYLNQWVAKGDAGDVFEGAWPDLADPSRTQTGQVSVGVAVAPDASWSSVAVAWRREDGGVHVSLSDNAPHREWVPGRVADFGGCVTVNTAAKGLIPGANEPSRSVQAQAHNALADLVRSGEISHDGDVPLDNSVRLAKWQPYGETQLLEPKADGLDVSPLHAAALAVHGLSNVAGPADFYTL